MCLADGSMLKLFRVKRWWSSARWKPYSLRFCRNAQILIAQDVPTVPVKVFYDLTERSWSAVLFDPLPGETLRQFAGSQGLDKEVLERLRPLLQISAAKAFTFAHFICVMLSRLQTNNWVRLILLILAFIAKG